MDDLIARLEAATEGSRKLDCYIAVHPSTPEVGVIKRESAIRVLLMPRAFGIMGSGGDDEVRSYLPATNADHIGIPHYTTSLDAALTLWGEHLDKTYPRRGINLFYACLPGGKLAWKAMAWEIKDGSSVIMHLAHSTHRVRPISACIAALKARQQGR